ncbi:HAD family hydrolase [Tumebacillus permanentifrigoris]|uniref:Putative hydrolase of the HAD superfamily n=1 Tax=Tumebacillus permanentifrigoris TaxID=378543 RepID=A0A316DR80_9BACL|nr:HAD-IA family hydrolase [Tumebacillus permanentifrigoris]PWK06956.1 putative hydrolase of the HAD superfamily [Tumebacillus permanentifrigoris]
MKAILLDLDETLFDHQHACASGLEAVRERCPELQQKSVKQLELEFYHLLNAMHHEVLQGRMTLEQARVERFRLIFRGCGRDVDGQDLQAVADFYSQVYQASRRPVPGAVELLTALRAQGTTIAVLTNHMTHVQVDKLEACGLLPLIDHLITSEDVGVQKPDPQIFHKALEICGVQPQDALMVGDSWSADILGAQAVGLPSVWLNRRRTPIPDAQVAVEIFELHELALRLKLSLERR